MMAQKIKTRVPYWRILNHVLSWDLDQRSRDELSQLHKDIEEHIKVGTDDPKLKQYEVDVWCELRRKCRLE